jgi:hypothetical protein
MAKITMKIHHSAGEFHGRKAIFNVGGRLATVDRIVNNAVDDSGCFDAAPAPHSCSLAWHGELNHFREPDWRKFDRRAYSTSGSFAAAAARNLCSQIAAFASRSSSFIMPSSSIGNRRHLYQAILDPGRVGKIERLQRSPRGTVFIPSKTIT